MSFIARSPVLHTRLFISESVELIYFSVNGGNWYNKLLKKHWNVKENVQWDDLTSGIYSNW